MEVYGWLLVLSSGPVFMKSSFWDTGADVPNLSLRDKSVLLWFGFSCSWFGSDVHFEGFCTGLGTVADTFRWVFA